MHADLIGALAGLIAPAAATVVIVTHSRSLVDLLDMAKRDDETRLDGQGALDEPTWRWPTR